ncbi:MAG: MATE family efflux transporter, partial [Clostridia bacterium]|nr:MATE family efflux transporter [Clostridia bacterium]
MENRRIREALWRLTLPIVLQNLLTAAVNSADVIMLNSVSPDHVAAVSLASNYASLLFTLFYGLGTGVTMLCAQYYGKGDMRAIDVVQGIALRFSVLSAMLFSACAVLIPEPMMRLFTP